MKRFVQAVLAVSLMAVSAGCGTSPLQACTDQGAAECAKMWSCSAAMKLGNDEADCHTSYATLCKIVQDGKCPSGKAMDVGKTVACTSDIQSQTCEQYKAGTESANCAAAKCD